MLTTTRLSKTGFIILFAVVLVPIAGYSQTDIPAGTSMVSLDGDTEFNVTGLVDTSVTGTDALTKTNGGELTINFTGVGALDAGESGIEITNTTLGDLNITTASSINPVITADSEGIFSDQRIDGNFMNDASITSLGNRAISITGAATGIDGSFTNSGDL